MNAHEVAAELGLNERTIRRAIEDGRLPATKNGAAWDIDVDEAREAIGKTAQTSRYQDALAEALRLLRAFNHEGDALAVERQFGLVYVEPRARVRAIRTGE